VLLAELNNAAAWGRCPAGVDPHPANTTMAAAAAAAAENCAALTMTAC